MLISVAYEMGEVVFSRYMGERRGFGGGRVYWYNLHPIAPYGLNKILGIGKKQKKVESMKVKIITREQHMYTYICICLQWIKELFLSDNKCYYRGKKYVNYFEYFINAKESLYYHMFYRIHRHMLIYNYIFHCIK